MSPLIQAMPIEGFVGGLMVGVAAAIMLLGAGRIAGVSGLAARATGIATSGAPRFVAAAFILGLPLGAIAMSGLWGPIVTRFPSSLPILIIGGLVVGFGTRLGSGCTSGHSLCGVSRLSRRSVVATAVSVSAAITTVALMNEWRIPW